MPTLYHATPISNYESIQKEGLIPQIGERSFKLDEQAGVFLFPNYEDCENALLNWLGEEFEDVEEEVITLEVTLPETFLLEESVDWEKISRKMIPPEYIKFYKNEG